MRGSASRLWITDSFPATTTYRLQTLCDEPGPRQIDALLRRRLAKLPHPFTPQDREAGYRYDVSILQAEFSLTQILDPSLSGRMLFEEIIRENLDLGRPDIGSDASPELACHRFDRTVGQFVDQLQARLSPSHKRKNAASDFSIVGTLADRSR
jgi:hypothetical protein